MLARGPEAPLLIVLVILAVTAVLFASLTVEIQGGVLSVRFGPSLIRKRVPLAAIRTCIVVRNPWWYGYAGTKPPLIFVSRAGGTSWTELESFRRIRSRRFWLSPAETPFTAYVQGIALSPTNSNVIVVGIEAGAVVRSDDGGQIWSDHFIER